MPYISGLVLQHREVSLCNFHITGLRVQRGFSLHIFSLGVNQRGFSLQTKPERFLFGCWLVNCW